jgi:hypothetical protein
MGGYEVSVVFHSPFGPSLATVMDSLDSSKKSNPWAAESLPVIPNHHALSEDWQAGATMWEYCPLSPNE